MARWSEDIVAPLWITRTLMYERFPEYSTKIKNAIRSSERGTMTLVELTKKIEIKHLPFSNAMGIVSMVATQMQQEGTLAWRDEFDGLGRKIVYFLPAEGAASDEG